MSAVTTSSCTIIAPGTETDEQYHRSGAWGSTLIGHFLHSPALAHQIISGAWCEPETAALRFGRILHHRLDPTFAFEQRYRVGPDVDRRTKTWAAAEATAAADGVHLISPDDRAQIEAMVASIRANAVAANLLDGAEHEVGFRMPAPQGAFVVQCRADVLHRWSYLTDLKTTADLDDFTRSIATYGYHRQAALYRWIISQVCGELLPFSFIVAEKAAPLYRCRVVDLSEEYLAIGWQEVEAALAEIGRRTVANDWRDGRDAELVGPPAWLVSQSASAAA